MSQTVAKTRPEGTRRAPGIRFAEHAEPKATHLGTCLPQRNKPAAPIRSQDAPLVTPLLGGVRVWGLGLKFLGNCPACRGTFRTTLALNPEP